MFITSPFNDHLLGGQSRSRKDVREVLLGLAEAEANVYPVADLIPLPNLTVDAVVQRQFAAGTAGRTYPTDAYDDAAEDEDLGAETEVEDPEMEIEEEAA